MLRCNTYSVLLFANGILSQQRIMMLKDFIFIIIRAAVHSQNKANKLWAYNNNNNNNCQSEYDKPESLAAALSGVDKTLLAHTSCL
jgi:hypothetical protein